MNDRKLIYTYCKYIGRNEKGVLLIHDKKEMNDKWKLLYFIIRWRYEFNFYKAFKSKQTKNKK